MLWWLADRELLPEARAQVADPAVLVAVSAASLWEIGIKAALGKLDVDGNIAEHLEAFTPLPITWAHATAAADLPAHHRDPFDRMLIAQARAEGLRLVTRDPAIAAYDVDVLPC